MLKSSRTKGRSVRLLQTEQARDGIIKERFKLVQGRMVEELLQHIHWQTRCYPGIADPDGALNVISRVSLESRKLQEKHMGVGDFDTDHDMFVAARLEAAEE